MITPQIPRKTCTIFCGAPGSGKGTHSSYMAERYNAPRLEMGEHFRRLLCTASDPTIVAELDPIRQGKYASDQFTIWEVKKWIVRFIGSPHIIFDGAVRTKKQLTDLRPFIAARGYHIVVIWLAASSDECKKRLLTNPRPGREDDAGKVVDRRMTRYSKHTEPLRETMENMGLEVHVIDNTKSSILETRTSVGRIFRGRMALQVA